MYFCPKCSYTFDITKKDSNIEIEDNLEDISSVNELLKLVKNNANLKKYKATFDKKVLNSNKRYLKLPDEEKKKINDLFKSDSSSGIIFKCPNCNNTSNISETIRLFEYSLGTEKQKISSNEENKLLCRNPVYPRTKDYKCKNINCITHKDDKLKEAIYFKKSNTYNVTYVCCTCYSEWGIN